MADTSRTIAEIELAIAKHFNERDEAMKRFKEVYDRIMHYDEYGTRIGETPNRICTVDIQGVEGAMGTNARLLAAAPEMYDLLRRLWLSLMAHPDYVSGENQEFEDNVESIEDLLSRIVEDKE
jgi:hypothetical protein